MLLLTTAILVVDGYQVIFHLFLHIVLAELRVLIINKTILGIYLLAWLLMGCLDEGLFLVHIR